MDQKPILTIIAGVNGAGKSTYMNQLKENSNILIHNPDSIRKKETKKNLGIGNLSIGRAIIKDRNQKLSLKQNMAWGHDIPAHDVKRRFRTSYENLKKIIPQEHQEKINNYFSLNFRPYSTLLFLSVFKKMHETD